MCNEMFLHQITLAPTSLLSKKTITIFFITIIVITCCKDITAVEFLRQGQRQEPAGYGTGTRFDGGCF